MAAMATSNCILMRIHTSTEWYARKERYKISCSCSCQSIQTSNIIGFPLRKDAALVCIEKRARCSLPSETFERCWWLRLIHYSTCPNLAYSLVDTLLGFSRILASDRIHCFAIDCRPIIFAALLHAHATLFKQKPYRYHLTLCRLRCMQR
jgi:hypothetical protein